MRYIICENPPHGNKHGLSFARQIREPSKDGFVFF